MRTRQKIAAIVIVILAGLAAYGLWETRQAPSPAARTREKLPVPQEKSLVDQSPLKTAQQLAGLASTHDQRDLAQEALRLADFDVDLAFDSALREARVHPPTLSKEAKEIEARLQKAEKILKGDQELTKQLTDQLAKAPDSKKDALQADLIQNQADTELDQDEVEDAKGDLIAAGGDVTGRIEALKKEHEDTTHATLTALPTGPDEQDKLGIYHRVMQWRQLHEKLLQLWQAKSDAESSIAELTALHDALSAKLDAKKAAIPELAHHSKKSASGTAAVHVSASKKREGEANDLLQQTQRLADDQKILSSYDQRIETEKELAGVYGKWIDLVAEHQRAVLHRGLFGVAIILAILLMGILFSSWMDAVVTKIPMDRRQVESLRTVTRVSLQILGLFLILLMCFGPPGELGTFLGLAGAGLTVALKDFIIGFFGWFVLMGKHGMRLGDWVEINGVTGEVLEIGPFHTVLLETGNWTDSGHPTGRRVTFTNSFAIEGHYFNFSTSGQWLWDELQIVLPLGKDPYQMVDAILKKVVEATRESTEQAEQEWRAATTSRELSSFSADPAISVKPILGGIEIAVRYITRASERYTLRSKLNRMAVELLGEGSVKATS